MRIHDAILAFGRDYLAVQVQPAELMHLRTLPSRYVIDLYADKFSYMGITTHLNNFLHVALNYHTYDASLRRRVNEIFRQAEIIRGEGHTRSENNLTAIVAVYLAAGTDLNASIGSRLYGERYEADAVASKLLTDVENQRLEFLQGWGFCAMYVLDTLCLAAHLDTITDVSTELTVSQQVWFQELTGWFEKLHELTVELAA